MNKQQQETTHRVYVFIMALYSIEIKEEKTCTQKFSECMRKSTEGKLEKELRKAKKLSQKVAKTVCPDHIDPLSEYEASTFKALLTQFADEITTLIELERPLQICRTRKFLTDWNTLARIFAGQFLHYYGLIHRLDVTMNDSLVLVGVLDMLRERIPEELSLILTSDVLKVAQTQIRRQNAQIAQARRVEASRMTRSRRMKHRIKAAFQNN